MSLIPDSDCLHISIGVFWRNTILDAIRVGHILNLSSFQKLLYLLGKSFTALLNNSIVRYKRKNQDFKLFFNFLLMELCTL